MQGNTDHMRGSAVDVSFGSLTIAQKVTQAWQWAVVNGKHSYAGTVPAAVVAKRRAKNRVAKQSRKVNRAG